MSERETTFKEDVAEKPQLPGDTRGRVITFAVFALILVLIWSVFDFAILIFVLTFVFHSLVLLLEKGLAKIKAKLPYQLELLIVYAVGIGLVIWLTIYFIPVVYKEGRNIAAAFASFDFEKFLKSIDPRLVSLAGNINIDQAIESIGQVLLNSLGTAGRVGFNFVVGIVISALLLIEKRKIQMIGKSAMKSRIAFIYRSFLYFGGIFCEVFGNVMRVQVIISLVNCAISTVALSILHFPYIVAISFMIFILGLIPVAGVVISLIPLSVIAFSERGIVGVVEVLILVIVIHFVEAYILNPKLMSQRTSLPVSVVFVILIVSEMYLGMWGLLIGVPVFVFLLSVLEVDYATALHDEQELGKQKKIERKRAFKKKLRERHK
ncbi:MAG: AI-2E family transporter [Clostridiales Family XIII bacterium]|jgi:predicted PurR-regulated permease PerM|nr:AI-2E family transporter [Clostridiales Family XIII bacterium]